MESKETNTDTGELLKARFLESDAAGFNDAELLELILSYSTRSKDVKKTAENLLRTFGSIRGIMTAPIELLQQVQGVDRNSAVLLNLAYSLTMLCFKEDMQENPVMADRLILNSYLRMLIGDNSQEKLFVMFLDKKDRLIGEWHSEGGCDSVKIDHLLLLKKMSFHPETRSVVIAHNHPSGICSPSQDDLNTTFYIKTVVAAFGVELKDHLIVTPDNIFSLMQKSV